MAVFGLQAFASLGFSTFLKQRFTEWILHLAHHSSDILRDIDNGIFAAEICATRVFTGYDCPKYTVRTNERRRRIMADLYNNPLVWISVVVGIITVCVLLARRILLIGQWKGKVDEAQ